MQVGYIFKNKSISILKIESIYFLNNLSQNDDCYEIRI